MCHLDSRQDVPSAPEIYEPFSPAKLSGSLSKKKTNKFKRKRSHIHLLDIKIDSGAAAGVTNVVGGIPSSLHEAAANTAEPSSAEHFRLASQF